MNSLRNIRLRTKLIAAFAFIAGFGAIITIVGGNVSTQRVVNDVIPSLRTFESVQVGLKTLQAETLEFVSLGEEETLAELQEVSEELQDALMLFSELADDDEDEDAEVYNLYTARSRELIALSQAVVDSQKDAHERLEEMDEVENQTEVLLEQVEEILNEEIERNIAIGNLDELVEDAIASLRHLTDFSNSSLMLLLETREFAHSGEAETLDELVGSRQAMTAALQNIWPLLEDDEPEEAQARQDLQDIEARLLALSTETIEIHQETLDLLEEYEELETSLESVSKEIFAKIDQDVFEGTAQVVTGATVTSLLLVILAVIVGWLITRSIALPVGNLVDTIRKFDAGDLTAQAGVESGDEIGILAQSFNAMAERLGLTLSRLQDTTRDLLLSAEIGQQISRVRQLDAMLIDAVELIRERYDLYYVQVYLVSPSGRELILAAGTGETGQRLLQRRHRLPIGLTSITGTVAVDRNALIIEDAESSNIHQANPLLPETCAEMALPLLIGERILGVLDLQSSRPGVFNQESLPVFEVLAGQLTVALYNSELFDQAEEAREKVEDQAKILVGQGWDEFLDGIERPARLGYLYEEDALHPLTEVEDSALEGNILMSAIDVVGEEVGSIQLEGDAEWSVDERELVESISQQVAQRLENLRLLAQSQQYQQEAEEALRRLTREGWASYQSEAGLSYIHSDQLVRPLPPDFDEKVLTFDFRVRNVPIGKLGVSGVDRLPESDQAFIAEVQEQLSNHIETLRLQEQTQDALISTEELYQGSERITRAANLDEVLDALVESTALTRTQRVGLMMYNRPWQTDNPPEQLTVASSWLAEGVEDRAPQGSTFSFEDYPISYIFSQNEPYLSRDVQAEEWSHEPSRQFIMNDFGVRGVAAFPLRIGNDSIGGLTAMSEGIMDLTDEEIRQIATLVDQAATVIQTQQLYQEAQLRARREQELREISESVRASLDPETILRKAARQVGAALGRRTVVRLGADQTADVDSDDGNTGTKSV